MAGGLFKFSPSCCCDVKCIPYRQSLGVGRGASLTSTPLPPLHTSLIVFKQFFFPKSFFFPYFIYFTILLSKFVFSEFDSFAFLLVSLLKSEDDSWQQHALGHPWRVPAGRRQPKRAALLSIESLQAQSCGSMVCTSH